MSSEQTLRVLIVDDELLARQRLQDLLEGREHVEVIATVGNGEAAVEAIRSRVPDLVFLDVQMPGLNGLDVVKEVGPKKMPVTIFVTAYDEYALKAFDLAALDYLLKPFDDDRFEQAFSRARERVNLQEVGAAKDRLLALLQEGGNPSPDTEEESTGHLERIAVEGRGQVRVVPVQQIDYITASGPYIELHTKEKTHLIRERMKTLEKRLDPDQFFRIHRSVIVRLERIESLFHKAGGKYAVQLKDGTHLKLSRSRREELEERLGLL